MNLSHEQRTGGRLCQGGGGGRGAPLSCAEEGDRGQGKGGGCGGKGGDWACCLGLLLLLLGVGSIWKQNKFIKNLHVHMFFVFHDKLKNLRSNIYFSIEPIS